MIRRITLFLLTAAIVTVSVPAMAADETTATTTATETTVAEEGAVGGNTPEPAAPATTVAPPETQADWTYRYLIPTGIVLALLVVGIITVQYFLQVVRKRYRVNE